MVIQSLFAATCLVTGILEGTLHQSEMATITGTGFESSEQPAGNSSFPIDQHPTIPFSKLPIPSGAVSIPVSSSSRISSLGSRNSRTFTTTVELVGGSRSEGQPMAGCDGIPRDIIGESEIEVPMEVEG